MRLLPDMREAQASRRVALSEGERLLGVLALEVTEACPYTTTLQVRQELGLPWLPARGWKCGSTTMRGWPR